jgi:drug/metabolite transporter (DMT)-like permease
MRSILGVMSIAANYYALSKINLVNAVALNRTSPIFAIIFSSVFLAEKVKKKYYFISLLAVIGMIFILKPTYQVSGVAQLCAIGSAVLAGGSYTVLRELRKYDSAETIMLYLSIISLLVVTPFLIMGDYVHMSPYEAVWLLGLGVFSMLAQYFMTKAYLCGLTGEVSLYSYMHIVFSAVFGIMIFDEGLSIATIIGISLILISGIVNIIFE